MTRFEVMPRCSQLIVSTFLVLTLACASSGTQEPAIAEHDSEEVPESTRMLERMAKEGYRAPSWDTSSANTDWRDFYEEVQRILNEKLREVGWCWWEELKSRQSNLSGTMSIVLVIGPNGVVQEVRTPSWDILSATTTQCVKDRARSFTFPETPNGKNVKYTWGIRFDDN